MRRKRLFPTYLLLVAAFGVGCSPQKEPEAAAPKTQPAEADATAPATLDQVAERAPAVLYFVKTDCGSNPMAIPLVQKIYAANADKKRFFVVMNADRAGAEDWAKEFGTTFPIIADPEKKIIRDYGIDFSQTGILVDKDLKETKRFGGYGRRALEDLNASLGTAKVDLTGAPESGVG